MEPLVLCPLFLALFAWFLSQFRNPALRLLAAIALLACGFASEAKLADMAHRGGDYAVFAALLAIMLAFFYLGIGEFRKNFYLVLDSLCKKIKKQNPSR